MTQPGQPGSPGQPQPPAGGPPPDWQQAPQQPMAPPPVQPAPASWQQTPEAPQAPTMAAPPPAPPAPASWQQAPQAPRAPTVPPPPPPAMATPPQASWQQAPRQPAAPPPPPPRQASAPPPAWTASLMSTTPVAGPAGFFYADVPNRAIAFIIDYILFLVGITIIGVIAVAMLGTNTGGITTASTGSSLLQTIVAYALVAGYFVFLWTSRRATFGMSLLGLQVGHEVDGRTMDLNQAGIRIAAMFGPAFVVSLLSSFALSLSAVASLVSFVWFIALVYTTAKSPTKQGLHDQYAHTMVVKAARRAS
jgi:uncharacterized RDD family membrane protein YckC